MFNYIYKWVQNLAFYLVLTTAVLQIIPNNSYRKYIKFFTGLILVLLIITPFLSMFGMNKTFADIYNNNEYKQEIQQIKEATNYLEGVDMNDYIPEEYVEEDQTTE